jgi:branched-chain amino acid transport system permease protein
MAGAQTTSQTAAGTFTGVRRGSRSSVVSAGVLGVAVLVMAYLPFAVYSSVTDMFVMFFVLLAMASMWNLLAGYAGLVSVGQQAYVGIGAYAVLQMAELGVQPFLAIPIAALVCAVVALPTSLLAFRLRGDYFAVGTWVIAEVYRLVFVRIDHLGGGSGRSLPGLAGMDVTLRQAATYWAALAVAVLAIVSCYVLLRTRVGLALTAVRDNEIAARSSGVKVQQTKRLVYLIAAAGTGAAGGVLIISTLNVVPDSVFSVQWSAYMIFIVVIGGLGSVEGPILGASVFLVLQQSLSGYGVWYLVVLGAVGIAAAIWLPRGLAGVLTARTGLGAFPTGYLVQASGTMTPTRGRRTE